MKYRLLIAVLAVALGANAQHEWVYSMQSFNLYDGVGAAAGMYERSALSARYRHQWVGVDGAPQTALISYHTRLNERLGLGIRTMAETLGAFDRTAAIAHLSWRTALGKGELAFALGGGVLYEKMSRDRIAALHADDPALIGAPDQLAPLVNASAMYRSERLFVGIEAQHLLPRESNWGELTTTGKVAELSLFTGSVHAISANWSVRPMAAVRYSTAGQLLPELQAGMWYRQNLWFGVGYRHLAAAYGFAEYRIRNKYRFAYSFGWPIVQYTVAPMTSGNHELMLGIFWGKAERRTLQSIRYFQ